jgi:hypothetical protein
MHIMQHLDDASSTLTEEVWQEVVHQTPATPAAPWRPESRVSRFFSALAASMALQQRKPWSPCQNNRIVFPSEMLAQQYPHLYIQVMCG